MYPILCSPQEIIKKLEKTVNLLIEESAQANSIGDIQTVSNHAWQKKKQKEMCETIHIHTAFHCWSMQALDKAKDAARKERMLCKQREQAQLTDQINLDLTYCVKLYNSN